MLKLEIIVTKRRKVLFCCLVSMTFRNRIISYGVKSADEFLANPKNARIHPQFQRDVMKAALQTVGFVAPVIESKSGVLLDGHERVWQGLQNNAQIPFVVVDVDESEEDYVLATFDPITGLAQYDAAQLDALLQEVNSDSPAIQQMLADLAASVGLYADADTPAEDPGAQIDKAAELQEKWQVKKGDLWIIGKHRLLCGDSTNADDVARVMGGEGAKLVVTDPPYGVEYADKNKFLNAVAFGNRIQTPIEGDGLNAVDTQDLWKTAFKNMSDVMCPGAVVYCFMPQGGDQMMMMMMMMGAGIEPRHELIWLKNNHVLGRVDYAYKHEPILYAWKAGGHKFYGDFQTSIIECNKPLKSDLHPTMKPVELIERLISNSSLRGEIVYDMFLGSGTTFVACEQTGRQGRGLEIAENYCAVILERMASMGLEPQLEDENG